MYKYIYVHVHMYNYYYDVYMAVARGEQLCMCIHSKIHKLNNGKRNIENICLHVVVVVWYAYMHIHTLSCERTCIFTFICNIIKNINISYPA